MHQELSTYDHYIFALVALIGTFGAVGLTLWLSQQSRYAAVIHSFRGITPPFLNVIGVLFALNLAFLANDTWSAHDRARDAVFQEAGALANIKVEALRLPPPLRDKVLAAVDDYVRQATTVEWPLLGNRQSSQIASHELDALLALLSAAEVGEALGSGAHSLVMAQVVAARSTHDMRVALSQTHVNPLKWLGMAFLGFLTLVSIVAVHVDQVRAAVVASLLFAAASAPTAAIVLIQGNPFQEPMGVSAAPIAALLAGGK
jgi:hypothetical protein